MRQNRRLCLTFAPWAPNFSSWLGSEEEVTATGLSLLFDDVADSLLDLADVMVESDVLVERVGA